MRLLDIFFFGWYYILDKTIYSYGAEKGVIGPKEHSFFITFLFHGINLWTVLRYLTMKYFNAQVPLYISLSLGVFVFVLGYLFFFKKRKMIVLNDVKFVEKILCAIVSIIYVVVSVYLMFKVGDYVRYILTVERPLGR